MRLDNPKKKRSLKRFVIYLSLIFLAMLIFGFFLFVRHVQNLAAPDSIPTADGIVVLTGKGGDRLMAAGQLLNQERGERLLISGVNKALSMDDVLELVSASPDKGICCIDLDYEAQDTIGNAKETHHWVESLNYEHIILVTSDYHMPRASMEIRNLTGRVRITPYPVREASQLKWWEDESQRGRMIQEYGKLLLTYLRNSGGQKERESTELPDLPSDTPKTDAN